MGGRRRRGDRLAARGTGTVAAATAVKPRRRCAAEPAKRGAGPTPCDDRRRQPFFAPVRRRRRRRADAPLSPEQCRTWRSFENSAAQRGFEGCPLKVTATQDGVSPDGIRRRTWMIIGEAAGRRRGPDRPAFVRRGRSQPASSRMLAAIGRDPPTSEPTSPNVVVWALRPEPLSPRTPRIAVMLPFAELAHRTGMWRRCGAWGPKKGPGANPRRRRSSAPAKGITRLARPLGDHQCRVSRAGPVMPIFHPA